MFNSSVDDSRMYLPSQAPPVVPQPVQTSRVVDRFDVELVQAPKVVALKHARLDKAAEKGQLFFKRS